jgi:DNA-binding transcriptional LysR family regulator
VRLGVPVALGLYLGSKIGTLLDRYKDLSVDLLVHDGVSDFIEQGLDLEVRVGPIADSSLISRLSPVAFAPHYSLPIEKEAAAAYSHCD